MAGVTDRPFRQLCRSLGAGLATSEMVTSNLAMVHSRKTQRRLDHRGETAPVSVQILGNDPDAMAGAARFNVANGADIIDINMGCPAKKVCRKVAGSALLRDESLVERIVSTVVAAAAVPVTLKIRTGYDHASRNGVTIARIAEDAGIAAIAVHGRTRACGYSGDAEYDTIAAIKQAVSIPVIANGDINNHRDAVRVLEHTRADGIMVGRGAHGRPWIFEEIAHHLRTGNSPPPIGDERAAQIIVGHIRALHGFYGEIAGVRIARKHVGWYFPSPAARDFVKRFNGLESPARQLDALDDYLRKGFSALGEEAA